MLDPFEFVCSNQWNELSTQIINNNTSINHTPTCDIQLTDQQSSIHKINKNIDENLLTNNNEINLNKIQDDQNNNTKSNSKKNKEIDENILDTFGTDSNLMQYIKVINDEEKETKITKLDDSDSKLSINSIDTCGFGSESRNVNDIPKIDINKENLNNKNTSNLSHTTDLDLDNKKLPIKKVSPLKTMLGRMKSNNLINNFTNNNQN